MQKTIISGILSGILLLTVTGCSSRQDDLLVGLRACNRLAVLECHFSKVVLDRRRNTFGRDDFLYEKIIAKVKYEVDMGKMTSKDIEIKSNDQVVVKLPRLELTPPMYEPNTVYTADSTIDSFSEFLVRPTFNFNKFGQDEKNAIRDQALQEIRQVASADTSSLWRQGETHARQVMQSVLQGLGYDKSKITIVFKK